MIAAAEASPALSPAFSYRHRVSFEDTNLVGNVYFVRFLSWQGRCRELFLMEHAPGVLTDLEGTLRLVTLNVSCEYFAELRALDDVEVSMSLREQRQHRIRLAFQYFVHRRTARILAAHGTQDVGCMRQTAAGLSPTAVPAELMSALEPFR